MATKVNMTGTITSEMVPIRNRPSLSGDIIETLDYNNGRNISVTIKDGEWVFSPDIISQGGWISVNHVALINNDQTIVNVSVEQQQQQTQDAQDEANKAAIERQIALIQEDLEKSTIDDQEIVDSLIVHNVNGIYGIPYQFMRSVDPRLVTANGAETGMGRKYSEKIISKMPLLCITPGKVKFMSNFSKTEQTGILADIISDGVDTDISSIIRHNGRYFTFEFSYPEYFEYVNALCQSGARFLDIQNVEINVGGVSAPASKFMWENALNKKLKATLTSQDFIGFYMDSTDSVSESFSNTTTQSQLASSMNGLSDKARELGFILGAGAGIQYQVMDEAQLGDTMKTIEEISSKYLNGSTLFSNIASNFATVATGGKLLFPEIWADSEFSRDFDITIKLRTPDSDVMSWYINIYVPLCHLIALAAGHQTDNTNGYYSPFLVRAFYKGLFNVDMGIITSMSIRKGKEAAWNIDGLPTEIDIDITIKDLYNMLSIVPMTEPKNFVTNNILMDYIANTCGININKLDIERSLEIYYILFSNRITSLPNRVMRQFQNAIDNYGMRLYDKVLNKFLI